MSTIKANPSKQGSAVDDLIARMTDAINSGKTSVVKLSSATGLSRMQIYRILNRENSPSLQTAESIAKVLGLAVRFAPEKKIANSR